MPRALAGSELLDALLQPVEGDLAGRSVVVEGPPDAPEGALAAAVDRLATLPCVVIGAPGFAATHPGAALVDAIAADDRELARMVGTAEGWPTASASLALHLRATDGQAPASALVAESATYSALQAGPEHDAWREATPVHPPRPNDDGPRLRARRVGDELQVTLARPQARNALDARMRDELLDVLAVAVADPAVQVVVDGEGDAFCAGGDLDEFGTRPDAATAHLVRLRRSLAAVLRSLAGRTTVHVHGPCAGSGVELPAFAGRVVAAPGTTFLLPELRMGLIPGAGGTVSLPRRIGRQATMALCLQAEPIDAGRALALGLVDEVGAAPLI